MPVEGFAKHGDAEGELDGRRDVSEQTEGGEPDPAGTVSEEQRRHGGDDTGAGEQRVQSRARVPESALAGVLPPKRKQRRRRARAGRSRRPNP